MDFLAHSGDNRKIHGEIACQNASYSGCVQFIELLQLLGIKRLVQNLLQNSYVFTGVPINQPKFPVYLNSIFGCLQLMLFPMLAIIRPQDDYFPFSASAHIDWIIYFSYVL
jgi:hypothetical protein